MHQLIASYLFQNRVCPLPGFGTLTLKATSAFSDFTSQLIKAPRTYIHFEDRSSDPSGLLNFVSAKANLSNYEANEALDHFCDMLKREISSHAKVNLDGVGNFFVDNNGNMIFVQMELPTVFSPAVAAERVIHPNDPHTILVGDKETTSMVMTEYFSEVPEIKDRWWVWALVLAAVGLLVLFLYFTQPAAGSSFGNAIKI